LQRFCKTLVVLRAGTMVASKLGYIPTAYIENHLILTDRRLPHQFAADHEPDAVVLASRVVTGGRVPCRVSLLCAFLATRCPLRLSRYHPRDFVYSWMPCSCGCMYTAVAYFFFLTMYASHSRARWAKQAVRKPAHAYEVHWYPSRPTTRRNTIV
jgi:hypothetical protein